jgi:ribosomal protein L31
VDSAGRVDKFIKKYGKKAKEQTENAESAS